MDPIVILGAGPGGLAAAHRLALHNHKTIILERQSGVGGLCRTIVHNGFRFDIGPHRWFTRNRELHNWYLNLMGDELVRVIRFTQIYYNGKLLTYPLKFRNVVLQAGLPETLLLGGSYLVSKLRSLVQRQVPVTMEDAYVAQFGRELFRTFFQDYSEKIWGRPCNEISADWVEQRTQGYSVFQAVRNAILKTHQNKTGLAEVAEYVHPRLGYGRISERMAEEILQAGGEILLNHEVRTVHHDGDRITGVSYVDHSGRECFLSTNFLISSIPLTVLIHILRPRPPEEVCQAAAGLTFRDLITVNLMFNKSVRSRATWIYLQDASTPFARLSIPSNICTDLTPSGCSSAVLEWFCNPGDELRNHPHEVLIKTAIDLLTGKLKLVDQESFLDAFVFYASKAYPVYTLDYQSRLRCIQQYLQNIRDLKIVGRGGTFHYHTSDHSIEMGWSGAADVLTEKTRSPE